METESTQLDNPSKRRPRRLLRIVAWTLVALIVAYGFLPYKILIGDRGFLAAGYGYFGLRAVTDNSYRMRFERPVFLVLWKTARPPVFGKGADGLTVNGRRVWPSQNSEHPSIYALQPDYTLRRLDLSDKERDLAFACLAQAKQSTPAWQTEFWQTRIDPELAFVESAPATQPEPAEPTDAQ